MINSEIASTQLLKDLWPTLPDNYREILTYLWSVEKLCNAVFPSLDRIAEMTKCAKSTVQRAIKFFEGLGIIAHVKRSYRSNLYFINKEISKINFRLKRWWITWGSDHVSDHVSKDSSSCSNLYVQDVPKFNEKEQQPAPFAWILKLPSFLQQNFMKAFNPSYAWIFKKASEYEMAMAYEDLRWYTSQPKGRDMSMEARAKLLFTLIQKRRNLKSN